MPATVRPAALHRVQRLNFSEESVTVRHTCDGPSCHSVTKFRESISVPNFQFFLSVLKRDPATVRRAHDGPSWGLSPQPVFPEIKSAAQND